MNVDDIYNCYNGLSICLICDHEPQLKIVVAKHSKKIYKLFKNMIKRIILVQNLAEKRWLTVNSLDTNLKKKKQCNCRTKPST